MGEANGSLKATNGNANGHGKGRHTQAPKRSAASKKKPGFLGWIFNHLARYVSAPSARHLLKKRSKENADTAQQVNHMVRPTDGCLAMPSNPRAMR